VKVCDKTCILCFFTIINKYFCMAKRSLLSERPAYLLCGSDYKQYVLAQNFLFLVHKISAIYHQLILLIVSFRYAGW